VLHASHDKKSSERLCAHVRTAITKTPKRAIGRLAIVLAFVFGYGLTMRSVLSHGLDLRQALSVALAADTVSI
jgi:Domain of unknown function (DUF4396)